ncbi:EAL domain-containing protein [Faecalicatena orotica]|uniref:EAL domain-containing protein n=1 Tax=Faecalicatena orotica TaxID=1544 RepID=UPI0032177C7B
MRWNIAAESISLVMLGIIWVYARKGSHLPTLKNKIFQWCLLVTFSAILTNILSTIMIYQYEYIPIWLTWIVTSVYFVLTPLMGLTYFLYTVSVIYTDMDQAKKVIGIGLIPGAGYTLLILVNPFTRNIFDINSQNGYSRGSWVFTTYLVFYIYCLASIVVTVCNRKKIEAEIYGILAAFPVLAVLVIFVQQLYPDVILSGSAATCALLIIYLHLQNKQISLDYLTNIPNRQELLNMIGLTIKKAPDKEFYLLVVSLRDFRQINNTCGQQKGDVFLKEVSQFLCRTGPAGNVYRFSGDEFALLFLQPDKDELTQCIARIQERMSGPWQVDEYRFVLPAVMGIFYQTGDEDTLEKIINSVECAVARAKEGKHGQVCYCDRAMLEKLERRRRIIQILKQQLTEPDFEMYYQPIYSVKSGEFLYAESLMRIPKSPIGPIYPSEFIPIAEETGLIVDITYIMLDKVCKFINRLIETGIEVGAVHVNFSGIQFSRPDLADRVLEIVQKNETPMPALEIEFTESTLAESTQVVTDFALQMLERGIKMGLDDFGTGYSNIATVIHIPFGTVKLDKSLVYAAMNSQKSALAIRNLTRTFKALGMKVIAEGVENEEQKNMVVEFGADQIQGFYYARPMPEDETLEFMLQKAGERNTYRSNSF